MHKTSIIALIAAFGLLATAAPADAIYIETPLVLEGESPSADVGDDVDFTIGPNQNNASAKDDWAGKTVKVGYSYDKNEKQEAGPDDSTSNDGYTEAQIGTVTLDDKASGSFTWSVPAAVDDRNVHLFIEDEAGDRLGFSNLAVGNATPIMYAASTGSVDGQPEIDHGQSGTDDAIGEASTVGVVGLLAVGVLALVGVARRR